MKINLKRSIGLPALIFYGLGTMVGGGFYALLGKIVGESGIFAPIALLLSGLIAFINSLSFAELASRFPVSAGESRYVKEGFNRQSLATLTGWLVIATGVISAATLTVATVGFLDDMFSVHAATATICTILILGSIAAWGIRESVWAVVIITLIEIGTLLLIVFLNFENIYEFPKAWNEAPKIYSSELFWGIFSASFLAFYSFIGFEDMVNMAEEVKNPKRNLAIAIPITVLLTTVLYCLVSLVAVGSGSLIDLTESQTPFAVLLGSTTVLGAIGIGLVSILAGINGALVQIVMASRVCYGMAQQNQAPSWLETINARTQTPIRATLAIASTILILALFCPMKALAELTSTILLVVFALVNLSLWRIKSNEIHQRTSIEKLPTSFPFLGFTLCCCLILGRLYLAR